MMVHRLALACNFTFLTSSPVEQALVATVINVPMLLLHVAVAPMRCIKSGTLQSVLLLCLTLLSASALPFAQSEEQAVERTTLSSAAMVANLQVACKYVIPVLAAVGSFLPTSRWRACRRCVVNVKVVRSLRQWLIGSDGRDDE